MSKATMWVQIGAIGPQKTKGTIGPITFWFRVSFADGLKSGIGRAITSNLKRVRHALSSRVREIEVEAILFDGEGSDDADVRAELRSCSSAKIIAVSKVDAQGYEVVRSKVRSVSPGLLLSVVPIAEEELAAA